MHLFNTVLTKGPIKTYSCVLFLCLFFLSYRKFFFFNTNMKSREFRNCGFINEWKITFLNRALQNIPSAKV